MRYVSSRNLACLFSCTLSVSAAFPAPAPDGDVVRRWDFDSGEELADWDMLNGIDSAVVNDGLLVLKVSDRDAFMQAPPVNIPLDGALVRVRLRADRLGHTQVYWLTEPGSTYGEQRQIGRTTFGSRLAGSPNRHQGFELVELPIGQPTDGGQTLHRFRVDPANGPRVRLVEIDFIELVRLPQQISMRFSASRHRVEAGDDLQICMNVTQNGGRAEQRDYLLVGPDGRQEKLVVDQDRDANVAFPVKPEAAGVHVFHARLQDPEASRSHAFETSAIVTDHDELPVVHRLEHAGLRLDLIATAEADTVRAARWFVASHDGEWNQAGWLLPLAQIVTEGREGEIDHREPAFTVTEKSARHARLLSQPRTQDDTKVEVRLTLTNESGVPRIDVETVGAFPNGTAWLNFSGPIYRCDRRTQHDLLDRYGLFGGLEFLAPGWRSSSARAVGDRFADRWTPHPFKVTLPVMAIEADGLTTAMMWHPLQNGTSSDRLPSATFASPNFLDDQPNHRMSLSYPSIPRWRHENDLYAYRPFVITSGEPIRLAYTLTAGHDLPVAETANIWYELYGLPAPPPAPHDDQTLYEIFAQNFGDTMYWPDEKGWRHHWYHTETTSRFVPYIAAELIVHALKTGETQWVERTGLQGRSLIDTAGTLARRLQDNRRADTLRAQMRDDHTWAFHNTEQIRETARKFTNGKYDSLGDDGSTSVGTCVQGVLPILEYALLTGDPTYVDPALQALEAMRRFRVPRGAQVWEVHQQIPDIRAAALAVRAYTLAYRITRDEKWLDDAHYWAWTGAPFAYSWRVPVDEHPGSLVATHDRNDWDRYSIPLDEAYQSGQPQVTPYGTIPVFGPSFYVVNWFGVIVQWCGLEWAQHVIELDRVRHDDALVAIAEGVVNSGLQQVFDKGPWIGMYPDSWHTQPNLAHAALIYAGLPLKCLQARRRLPNDAEPWTRVLHAENGDTRWHISGWGEPVHLDPLTDNPSWTARVRFFPDQPSELLICGVARPWHVRIAGQPVPEMETPDNATSPGWRYDADRSVVVIRFAHEGPEATIAIGWQEPGR